MSDLIPIPPDVLTLAGKIANQVAAGHVFTNYQERKAHNTLKRQVADLALFADYLAQALAEAGTVGSPTGADLASDPQAWQGITWGLVAGFPRWLLARGYAVGSVNVRLSTVKTYARLAMQAGELPSSEYTAIRAVTGYPRKEAKHVNAGRVAQGLATRRATRAGTLTKSGKPVRNVKKAAPVIIDPAQAKALKAQPDTPQGRRDRLIMCLLLDHGLRAGELTQLTVDNFSLTPKGGKMTFYRPKVDKIQTHKLTPDTLAAVRAWLNHDGPALGPILRGSRKAAGTKHAQPGGGDLARPGMSERAITKRVGLLGRSVGLEGLSAHDCRHYWATQAARNGTDAFSLLEAGGWTSLATVQRYVEAAKIANQGVNLGGEESEAQE